MPAETVVQVKLDRGSHEISIGRGLLAELGARLSKLGKSNQAAIVTDSTVGPKYAQNVADSLKKAGIEPIIATIPAGEAHKTLADLAPVYDTILGHKVERTTP